MIRELGFVVAMLGLMPHYLRAADAGDKVGAELRRRIGLHHFDTTDEGTRTYRFLGPEATRMANSVRGVPPELPDYFRLESGPHGLELAVSLVGTAPWWNAEDSKLLGAEYYAKSLSRDACLGARYLFKAAFKDGFGGYHRPAKGGLFEDYFFGPTDDHPRLEKYNHRGLAILLEGYQPAGRLLASGALARVTIRYFELRQTLAKDDGLGNIVEAGSLSIDQFAETSMDRETASKVGWDRFLHIDPEKFEQVCPCRLLKVKSGSDQEFNWVSFGEPNE